MAEDEDTETTGDHYRLACPYCGANNALWESVGRLNSGDEWDCGSCEKTFILTSVEPTVYITANRKKEETSGTVG
jgi:transposase-like protein